MSVLFVTGAGTGVGKTYVATGLVRALRAGGQAVRGLKPVVSGVSAPDHPSFADSDPGAMLAAQGLAVNLANADAISPWRFTAPLGPDLAAEAEGRTLEFVELVAWTRAQIAAAPRQSWLVIEGVGGVMSPACSDATVLDWIEALGCAALLVGGSYLGAVSHTLTALACLSARGVEVAAVVVSESEGSTVALDAAAASLRRFAGPCRVEPLRRGEGVELWTSPGATWGGLSSLASP